MGSREPMNTTKPNQVKNFKRFPGENGILAASEWEERQGGLGRREGFYNVFRLCAERASWESILLQKTLIVNPESESWVKGFPSLRALGQARVFFLWPMSWDWSQVRVRVFFPWPRCLGSSQGQGVPS